MKVALAVVALIFCYSYANAQSVVLSGTIRDFAPATMVHANYPASWWKYNGWVDYPTAGGAGTANAGKGFNASVDFERPLWTYGTIKTPDAKGGVLYDGETGLVGTVCNANNGWTNCSRIGSDRKPVYAHKGSSPLGTVESPASFYTWFHDSPASMTLPFNLTLTYAGNSIYKYESKAFFPLDGRGWNDWNYDDNMKKHNFAFCFETHSTFTYTGGQVFTFVGDDDAFLYIDDRLVGDVGGLHTEQSFSVNLDSMAGLQKGKNYKLDFFYCERHGPSSKFTLATVSPPVPITTTAPPCSYYDWCGICEGDGQSCCSESSCDDNNACTDDSCAMMSPPTVSCVHTPVNCTDTNKCINTSCDRVKGCTYTQISCDDNNACTRDSCTPSTGCKYTKIC